MILPNRGCPVSSVTCSVACVIWATHFKKKNTKQLTPLKFNGWNLRIRAPWKLGKSSSKAHHVQVLCVKLRGCIPFHRILGVEQEFPYLSVNLKITTKGITRVVKSPDPQKTQGRFVWCGIYLMPENPTNPSVGRICKHDRNRNGMDSLTANLFPTKWAPTSSKWSYILYTRKILHTPRAHPRQSP